MVGIKIIRQSDGRHKNNWPKGWMDGELYGRNGNNLQNGWRIKWLAQKQLTQGMDG